MSNPSPVDFTVSCFKNSHECQLDADNHSVQVMFKTITICVSEGDRGNKPFLRVYPKGRAYCGSEAGQLFKDMSTLKAFADSFFHLFPSSR